MPVLLDGNNAMHRLPGSERSRDRFREEMLRVAHSQKIKLEVIFDGPPPEGTPETERLGAVTIRYSGSVTADDLIVSRLPTGRAARSWIVVTDDQGLRQRVRAAGARVEPVSRWLARKGTTPSGNEKPENLSPQEIEEWERYFLQRDE